MSHKLPTTIKTCQACLMPFSISNKTSKAQREAQRHCSLACRGLSVTKAATMRDRQCAGCHRTFASASFRKRPTGVPFSYCSDCETIRSRLRPARANPQPSRPGRYQPGFKSQARAAVSSAIRSGRLLPQPCEVCGLKAEAHHSDYSRPLDVRWLCPSHHGVEHWKPVSTPLLAAALAARGITS